MKIRYNSPVILTYAFISIAVLAAAVFGRTGILAFFTSPARLSFSDPAVCFRYISYIAGHAGWTHLIGNLTVILLVGPLLEEKYGSWKLLEMILVTAAATALLNAALFQTSLAGGSGIAFMLILLASFSNIRSGDIPLTFILIAILFIGSETAAMIKPDRISQFSHLFGGLIGAGYGFVRGGRR